MELIKPWSAFSGTTTNEVLDKLNKTQTEDNTIVQMVLSQMESDTEDESERIITLYKYANTEERAILDSLLTALCGWSLASICKLMSGEEPEI